MQFLVRHLSYRKVSNVTATTGKHRDVAMPQASLSSAKNPLRVSMVNTYQRNYIRQI